METKVYYYCPHSQPIGQDSILSHVNRPALQCPMFVRSSLIYHFNIITIISEVRETLKVFYVRYVKYVAQS
jgi:hypothetical protein